VVNRGSDSVSVISQENNTLIKDIPVGDGPVDIDILGSIHTAYVVNRDSNTVSVIDTTNNTLIKDIPVGDGPVDIGIRDSAYVVNSDSDSVSVINTTNNTWVKDIPVGCCPIGIDFDYSTDTAYVLGGAFKLSVINTTTNTNIKNISVSLGHTAIGFREGTNTAYVVNGDSNTVSVIDTTTNTNIKNISVGDEPVDIGIDEDTETAYVVNRDSDSVSVISQENNTLIKDIPVGDGPVDIGFREGTNTAYVVNGDSNTVSVIDTTTNTNIKNISVGDGPVDIGIDEDTETAYVVNRGSDSVSVIDIVDNKVVAGITFDVKPFNSGYIDCDGSIPPLSQYLYVWPDTECIAKYNQGFEFVSWQENLNGNSTRMINVSQTASPLDAVLDFLHMRTDKPEATLKVSTFGSFTANFKELPPPLPAEYWTTLFGFVLTTGLGVWLIPSLVRWARTRADTKKSNYFYQKIKSLYSDGILDENDLKDLDKIRIDVTDAHSKGKLNELHYNTLKNEISMLYEEIFKKRIESLSTGEDGSREELQEIGKGINDAHSKGKINEVQYNNLKNEISIKYDRIFRKNIDSLKTMSNGSLSKRLNILKENIEIAHSEQKITEAQFNSLYKKISYLEKT
jgi:YVTN family beta-propeller protein